MALRMLRGLMGGTTATRARFQTATSSAKSPARRTITVETCQARRFKREPDDTPVYMGNVRGVVERQHDALLPRESSRTSRHKRLAAEQPEKRLRD